MPQPQIRKRHSSPCLKAGAFWRDVVNGEPAIVLNAPRTNNWHVVGTLSVTVHLHADNNTIEFSNPSANGPDLDRIIVQT
ncbi:MAG TPA: hypothetical protein VK667_13090 [Ktedonobacteraceae bacterium]|nr:hypothetical protein [Ktedonobacteraceae bacterium]